MCVCVLSFFILMHPAWMGNFSRRRVLAVRWHMWSEYRVTHCRDPMGVIG